MELLITLGNSFNHVDRSVKVHQYGCIDVVE